MCRQQNIYAKTAASPNETTIVFAGDILFDDHYAVKVKMNQRGRGIEGSISQEMLDVMRSADIFMVNNEFPYSDRGTPTENKKFTFRAKPEYASYLLDMGADIVSLANNHAYDYGKTALLDTLDLRCSNKCNLLVIYNKINRLDGFFQIAPRADIRHSDSI